jgi:hypothetical protein
MSEEVCSICNLPVEDGQPRYSRTNNHWECEKPNRLSPSEVIAQMDAAIEGLTGKKPKKQVKPVGEGPTAKKLKIMIEQALLDFYEAKTVDGLVLWVQPPAYRGPRWDLSCWGGHAVVDGLTRSFHSLATMTECVKAGKILYSQHMGDIDLSIYPAPQESRETSGNREQPSTHAMQCWSCKKQFAPMARIENDGHCPHCNVEIELDGEDDDED